MGIFTSGDFNITLKNEADAKKVYDMINVIQVTMETRTASPAYFDVQEFCADIDIVYGKVYSPRVQNGEYQIETIISEIKRMVKEKEIEPPLDFTAELMIQHESWYLDSDEEWND